MDQTNNLAQATALEPAIAEQLRNDNRRIVIVGSGGWIGRVLLSGIFHALGEAQFAQRVECFGSAERLIVFGAGLAIKQHPLADAKTLSSTPTILFHLAFLTKDKVSEMDEEQYVSANRKLSEDVHEILTKIGVERLFYASSGAAAFADDKNAASDLRLYGKLKRADEIRFTRWAEEEPNCRRAVITRIFSLSGPFINKHETYALASFIGSALSNEQITVTAPMPVYRSYVAIRELLSLVVAQLLTGTGPAKWTYDSGGLPIELAEVASEVARALAGTVNQREITALGENVYCGDDDTYRSLLSDFGIMPVPLPQQIKETAVGFGKEWS